MRVLLLLAGCFSGCLFLLPPSTPMAFKRDDLPEGGAKCLVVFLPGINDSTADFDEKGFVQALRRRSLSVDVVSAQATLSYYTQGQLVERLGSDIVGPAQTKNYRQTWLIGVSLGGMGTLLYSHAHPDEVTGVLALAPYLGKHYITNEITAAGGLATWQAPGKLAKIDVRNDALYQRELWRWLQAVASGKERGPELYVGWGTEDRLLARSSSVLAAALPQGRSFPVKGGHQWVAWKTALELFLAESEFSRSCAR